MKLLEVLPIRDYLFSTLILVFHITNPCYSVGPLPLPVGGQLPEWCYWEDVNCDPNTWVGLGVCEIGSGDQSPIDLDVTTADGIGHVFTHNPLHRMNFFYGNEPLIYTSFGLINTGHSIQFSLPRDRSAPLFIDPFEPGKGKRYAFEQGHFHWGSATKNGVNGSEHAINGRLYGGELHLVHYSEQYGSFANAVNVAPKDPEAILVVAILLEITVGPNPFLEPIVRHVPDLYEYDPSLTVRNYSGILQLDKLFPANLDFFRYDGSLTTPPCSEQVLFLVFKNPIPISNKQLAIFRGIKDFENLLVPQNFRHLQPRNGRRVEFYKVHQTYNFFWGLPFGLSYLLGSIVTIVSEIFNFSRTFPLRILGQTNVTQFADSENLQTMLMNLNLIPIPVPELSFNNFYTVLTQFS